MEMQTKYLDVIFLLVPQKEKRTEEKGESIYRNEELNEFEKETDNNEIEVDNEMRIIMKRISN